MLIGSRSKGQSREMIRQTTRLYRWSAIRRDFSIGDWLPFLTTPHYNRFHVSGCTLLTKTLGSKPPSPEKSNSRCEKTCQWISDGLRYNVFKTEQISLLPFSRYCERQTFLHVFTRLKHSSLSRITVAFWSTNMSNFDSSASIEAELSEFDVLAL